MTENEARFIAQRIFNSEDLYIMLSTSRANMMTGESVPYIGLLENGEKILFVFTSYESAKAYVDGTGYEVLDGIYPIAKIDQNDKYRDFYQICNTAVNMGISSIDIDLGTKDAFGCKIMWMLEVNDRQVEDVALLVSKEAAERLSESEEAPTIQLHFNSMKIVDFENPFAITEEQTERLFTHIFSQTTSYEDIMFNFKNNQTLLENCFLADRINTKLIPQAVNEEREKEAIYFGQISQLLERVIWDRIFDEKVYTMADRQTGQIYANNHAMYLVYTDRFKYMGAFEYVEVRDRESLIATMKDNDIKQIVVTDGPNYMCVINEKTTLGE